MNIIFIADKHFCLIRMDQQRKAIKTLRDNMLPKAERVAHSLGFGIRSGAPNRGAGDCLWECILDQLCHRDELHNVLNGRDISIQELRNEVVEGLSHCGYAKMVSGNGKNDVDWVEYLQPLRQPQYYDGEVGDLALPGFAHQFGVNIILLYTSEHLGGCPYEIIPTNCYGGQAITQYPILMAYNGDHMESVIPKTKDDLNQTVRIINQNILGQDENEDENEDSNNFTLPTPPYVPLALNKEKYDFENKEHQLKNMEEEANRIKVKKKMKTELEKKKIEITTG